MSQYVSPPSLTRLRGDAKAINPGTGLASVRPGLKNSLQNARAGCVLHILLLLLFATVVSLPTLWKEGSKTWHEELPGNREVLKRMALIRPDLSRPGYNNVICTEHYLQGRKKACKPVRQETLRDWEKSNVSGHCCKRISYSYDTWNTLFCKGLKEIHVEIINVTCTGHEQSGLKDLDASLGCYHPKRTKVYGPTVLVKGGVNLPALLHEEA